MIPENIKKYTPIVYLLTGLIVLSIFTVYKKGLDPITAVKEYLVPQMGERQVTAGEIDLPWNKAFLNIATGDKVILSDLKGKALVINFWATWCGPCMVEKPSWERLNAWLKSEGYGDEVELLFISHEDEKSLSKYITKSHSKLNIYKSDPRGLGVLAGLQIPRTYILNTKGQMIYNYVGTKDWASLKEKERLLELIVTD